MTLIQQMQQHVNNDNVYYIDEIAQTIIEVNLLTEEDLKLYEEKYNSHMPIEESLSKWIKMIDNYPYEYDILSYDEIQESKRLRKMMDSENLDEKVLNLVKYFYLTNRDNPYIYQTYKFIIQDKL